MRALWSLVLCACASQIPAARFAPDPAWTPATYRIGPPPAKHLTIDQDDQIADIAFLEHAIGEAWAPVTGAPITTLMRDYGREVPLTASTRRELCDGLAEAYRHGDVRLSLDGVRCGASRVKPAPVQRRAPIPAGKNYEWHRETQDGVEVGVLAIEHFAPPGDPGWAELPHALRELAALDLAVIDLQAADGDDPRVGFAVLAALGLEDFSHNRPRPMQARDTPLAAVVRASYAALYPGAHARSRELWTQFGSGDAIRAIGRSLADVKRTAPIARVQLAVGFECATACQLLESLAEFQTGVELASTTGVEDALNGDELGAIRLPHSGIDVTFPTVAYGTLWGGGAFGNHNPVDLVALAIAELERLGAQRALAKRWATAELPDCAQLPVDRTAIAHKRSGCFDRPTIDVILGSALDSARTRSWLASCGISVDTTITNPITLETIATAHGRPDVLARIAHAPFVIAIDGLCPPYPE